MDSLARASAKISRKLIPFLMLCYFVAYLDRVNVGFAALTMNKDLGLNAEMFGFGAGIFFFGYFIFEVPSNLLLEKFGARMWIARIMISWGVVSAAMAFVTGPYSFYAMRFLLGVAEAGFFPGIILYLTYWFTAAERARYVGLFMAAIPLSSVIGGPVSGLILDHFNGAMALNGWQWLFIIEGVPSIIVGFLVLLLLTDRPKDATWLAPDERDALNAKLAAEAANRESVRHYSLKEALLNPRVLALSLVYFGLVCGNYGLGYWLPTIVKGVVTTLQLDASSGININTLTGYLVAIPYAVAVVAMIWWTRRSDLARERMWHVAGPAILGGVALAAAAYLTDPLLAGIAVTACAVATYAALPTFWTLPTAFLTGTAAAGGIALINSIGNIGGFAGPYAVGWLKDATGGTTAGLLALAAAYVLAGVVTLLVGHDRKVEMVEEGAGARSNPA
ncbi:MAG: MFS transporter [Alphaproteobacteria bacterium]|nr:MFS transporter [Alphaproteobacteria bacterium]